jgi:predicted permease
MPTLLLDLKFAFRQLRKSPGFAATAVLMLAFGIGATTAIFSIVEGVLLRPLPFPDPDRLMVLADRLQGADVGGNGEAGVTVPDIRSYTRDTHSFTSLGGYQFAGFELSGNGDPAQVNATRMTGGVFPALGVAPLLGRVYTQQEDDQSQPVVVLSYGTWQSRFHGDAKILGTKILLDRKPYLVIGVMPRNFEFPLTSGHLNRVELWVPMSFRPDELVPGASANWSYQMVGRLKAGVTPSQAQSDAERVAQDIMRGYPSFMTSLHISSVVRPLQEETVEQARPLVRTLFFAVAIVLLIACANLAGLAMVRISRRTQEIATRMALGASRTVLIRQLWIENLMPAALGALAGLTLAAVILYELQTFLPADLIPLGGISVDGRVLFFTVAATFLTTLLFGALPALATRRVDLRSSIASSYSVAGGTGRLRKVLIVAEVALTVVLVAAAGLMVHTLAYLETLPPGFDSHNVITAKASLDDALYKTPAAFQSLLTKSLVSMRQIPGVEEAAVGLSVPYERGLNWGIRILDGKQAGERSGSSLVYVTPDYFAAFRIPLLSGRGILESDSSTNESVIVINASFAKQFFGTTDVVGRHIGLWMGPHSDTPRFTIIGVVGDVAKAPGMDPVSPIGTEPVFYVPAAQFPADALLAAHTWFQPSWIVRTHGPVAGIADEMQRAMADTDPNLPFSGFYSMDDLLREQLQMQRVEVMLLTTLAGLALMLSAVGIYSLVSNLVLQRTREIGIRMALGASVRQAIAQISFSGLTAAGIGLVLGLGLSFLALRVLRSQVYGVAVYDPLTLVGTPLLLALIAALATLIPAARITRIDPAQTLRSE